MAAHKKAGVVADLLARNVGLETDDIDQFFDNPKKSCLRPIQNFIFFPIFCTNVAIKLLLWFFSRAVLGPLLLRWSRDGNYWTLVAQWTMAGRWLQQNRGLRRETLIQSLIAA